MTEKAVWIDYAAQLEPPYKWKVLVIGEKSTKLIIKQGQGSWVTAMFEAQDLKKQLGIRSADNIKQIIKN